MFNRYRSVLKPITAAVTVDETAVTWKEVDAKGTNIGNQVQEMEQELPPLDQIRAKESQERTMTNVDYVGKKVIGQ